MWLLKLTFIPIGLYAIIVGIAYLLQTWLIFPTGLVGEITNLPPRTRHIDLETEGGKRVVLVRIPPSQIPEKARPYLLGFGGNVWNADAVAIMLHQIFPEHEIIALHYRGYRPSTGSPSAAAMFDDARRAFDHIAGESSACMIAIGFSIGASVAVELAATRSLQGIVMVTPFDSLKELAAIHYPWLPVRLLLRHRMEATATLRGLDVPAAVITAGSDRIVPKSRSTPVREAARNLRANFTIETAGHNDVYDTPDFIAALRKSVNALARD